MRFDAFDPVATRALAVVAADDTGRSAIVRLALQQLGEPADALDRAELTGVIETDGPDVRFAHPVLRAVAYHRVAPASRRAAHGALAAALARSRGRRRTRVAAGGRGRRRRRDAPPTALAARGR